MKNFNSYLGYGDQTPAQKTIVVPHRDKREWNPLKNIAHLFNLTIKKTPGAISNPVS